MASRPDNFVFGRMVEKKLVLKVSLTEVPILFMPFLVSFEMRGSKPWKKGFACPTDAQRQACHFVRGICTIGQGFTQNLGGLVTYQALVDLFESGLCLTAPT